MALPAFQGRGVATSATSQVIERVKAARKHRFLYAYPSVDNAPSNTICRKLGFTLVDVSEYEYPKDSGKTMRLSARTIRRYAGSQSSSVVELKTGTSINRSPCLCVTGMTDQGPCYCGATVSPTRTHPGRCTAALTPNGNGSSRPSRR
jgi:hypothetical protein